MKFIYYLTLGTLLIPTSCKVSYPKETLHHSIQNLFQKELNVSTQSRLVGKTLYVAFNLTDLFLESTNISNSALEKLDLALNSILRISLSTDAEVDMAVLDIYDPVMNINLVLIKRVQDHIKQIRRPFVSQESSEKIVIEISNTKQIDFNKTHWHDISLEEFMGRWVSSKFNIELRANPILGTLLGISTVIPKYEHKRQTLVLSTDSLFGEFGSEMRVREQLIKNHLFKILKSVEAKYLRDLPEETGWAKTLLVKDSKGHKIIQAKRFEWDSFNTEEKNSIEKPFKKIKVKDKLGSKNP